MPVHKTHRCQRHVARTRYCDRISVGLISLRSIIASAVKQLCTRPVRPAEMSQKYADLLQIILSFKRSAPFADRRGIKHVKSKTSFAANKVAFYRAFNGIFGKLGRNTSEEVLFELIKTKCLSVLYYGTEACPTNLDSTFGLQP